MTDLVVCDRANDRVLIYQGTASGLDPVAVVLPVPGQPVAVTIGDLNGDGSPDMAISAMDAEHVSVITSWTDTGSTVGFTADLDGSPTNTTIADVNGDGTPDLVVCIAQQTRLAIFRGMAGGGLSADMQMDTMCCKRSYGRQVKAPLWARPGI